MLLEQWVTWTKQIPDCLQGQEHVNIHHLQKPVKQTSVTESSLLSEFIPHILCQFKMTKIAVMYNQMPDYPNILDILQAI